MNILSKPVATTQESNPASELNRESLQATGPAFVVLFCIVGMALWGLPFYYDLTGIYTAGFLALVGMGLLGVAAAAALPKGPKLV